MTDDSNPCRNQPNDRGQTEHEARGEAGGAVEGGVRPADVAADGEIRPTSPTAICSMCKENPAKYTCPGCGRKTCGVVCVNGHKTAFSCSGKRDRTAFVNRGDLSYDTLVSDFKFLEEVERVEDVSKRTQPPLPRRQLPKPLKVLIQQAKIRQVTLQLMSPGMKRRKENSTRYDYKTNVMFWRVKWVFSDGTEGVHNRASEQTVLGDLLDKSVHTLYPKDEDTPHGPDAVADAARRWSSTYKVSMHQEGVRADQAVDFEVDLSQTLGEFLKGKVVIEFPVFRVQRES